MLAKEGEVGQGRSIGRNFFKKVLFVLISSLTLYIGNVFKFAPPPPISYALVGAVELGKLPLWLITAYCDRGNPVTLCGRVPPQCAPCLHRLRMPYLISQWGWGRVGWGWGGCCLFVVKFASAKMPWKCH